MEEYDKPRSAALGNCSAWLGVDNFIQSFDALSKFFRTRLSQALANLLIKPRCMRLAQAPPGAQAPGSGYKGG